MLYDMYSDDNLFQQRDYNCSWPTTLLIYKSTMPPDEFILLTRSHALSLSLTRGDTWENFCRKDNHL